MLKKWMAGVPLAFALVAAVALVSETSSPASASSLPPLAATRVSHQAAGSQQSQTQEDEQARVLATPQRFTALAADMSGSNRPTRTVEIAIRHWSTDAQRDHLLQVLRDKGQDALLDALQKMPVVGTIRTPDSLAYDLHYARARVWGDGGEQVLIATDRDISYWEAANATRSMQYPFTVIQLRVKANGEGEGRMSLATKVIAAGREIVLENYDSQPILLTGLTRE